MRQLVSVLHDDSRSFLRSKPFHQLLERELRGDWICGNSRDVEIVVQRHFRHSPCAPFLADEELIRDPEQPADKPPARLIGTNVFVRPPEGLLRQVVRAARVVAGKPTKKAPDGRLMLLDERRKRLMIIVDDDAADPR
jgi:hypothetical protein